MENLNENEKLNENDPLSGAYALGAWLPVGGTV